MLAKDHVVAVGDAVGYVAPELLMALPGALAHTEIEVQVRLAQISAAVAPSKPEHTDKTEQPTDYHTFSDCSLDQVAVVHKMDAAFVFATIRPNGRCSEHFLPPDTVRVRSSGADESGAEAENQNGQDHEESAHVAAEDFPHREYQRPKAAGHLESLEESDPKQHSHQACRFRGVDRFLRVAETRLQSQQSLVKFKLQTLITQAFSLEKGYWDIPCNPRACIRSWNSY